MPSVKETIGHVLMVKFSGALSASEFLNTLAGLSAVPDFDTLQFVLNDFTEVTDHDLDNPIVEPAVYAISSASKLSNPNIRVVAVSSDPRVAQCVTEINRHNDGPGYAIYLLPTLDEAWDWIHQQTDLFGQRSVIAEMIQMMQSLRNKPS